MEKVITENNVEEILGCGLPVMIDFWAPWCGPCRVLAPIVEELASEYEGRVAVAKCNVDDCEDLSIRFGIRNIPTLIFVRNGEVVDKTVGLQTKKDIQFRLDNLL